MAPTKKQNAPPTIPGLVADLASSMLVRSCGHVCKNPFITHSLCDACMGGGFCGCGLCEERAEAAV